MPVGAGETGVNKETGAVLHQAVANEGELGLLARSLAMELGVRVGGRGMRVVGALVAVEIRFSVAPAAAVKLVRTVNLSPAARQGCPSV